MDHVGVIYGNVGITEFKFAVSDPTLKRTDYIKVQHDREGWVLAQVMDVVRETSLSFDEATAMSHGVDQVIEDRLTAKAKVVGYRDPRGILQSTKTPFRAGIPVYRADEALIMEVFGLRGGKDEGAYIGFIKGYDIPVTLDINTLVQKHVSVLAKTGSGKSYVVGVLMEELMKRDVPIVVIDPHGEHDSLAHPNLNSDDFPGLRRFHLKPRGFADRIMKYSPDPKVNADAMPLKVAGLNLKAQDIVDLLGSKITNAQMGILHQCVKTLQESAERYTLEDIIVQVKNHQSNAKWNLASGLEFLLSLDLFDEKGTPLPNLVKKGKVTVVCLKGVSPDVQEIVVAKLIKGLFEARKVNKIPPFMLVVEEAHNFCPERSVAGAAMSGDSIRTVASEGRKFGMGLTIISQRPAKIDKNVLSQCNTQIILKVTNPNDLKAISASVEGLTADIEDEIQRIPVGVAIVSHPTLAVPAFVEVRPRETQHGGRSVDVLHYNSDDLAAHEEPPAPLPVRSRPAPAPVAPAPE
ncbi:MAG TPA: ATP-binding protein, partial [Candidatus Thermoplasmatota archaeon]|nr:ATP-binding protein [Candidatus Thermoplasmatota archaeon]